MKPMRAFYLSTYEAAAARLARGVPELSETREELDHLGKLIIEALAERKQYPYNPDTYNKKYILADIHPEIMLELYVPILEILCEQDSTFKMAEEVRRIDYGAMSLLQERVLKAYGVAAYKKLHKIDVSDGKREEEVLGNAKRDSVALGIDPEKGACVMKLIIKKTKELEEIIFENYGADFVIQKR